MVGTSLPLAWLTESDPKLPDILALLKSLNVGSVELRTVRPHHQPEKVLEAAKCLWENGFQITVHGSINTAETAPSDVFAPLQALLPALQQEKLNVTVHPIVGDNVAMLTELSDFIFENALPVTIALENNRLMPDKTEGDSAQLVLDTVKAVARENIGICFDMGHYAYYVKKNCPEAPATLPDKDFWKYVIHTHIHAMDGLRTHFPLDGYELPLEAYLDKLSCGYFGVYNLELDFPRIAPLWEPVPALENAIAYLQRKLHFCAKLYDEVREHFDDWFYSALRCWDEKGPGTTFGLIHSTAYLFCTNGCRWAMDIAFRNAKFLAKTPAEAAKLLADMDFMLLSHRHADHFEISTLQQLAKTKTLLVVPDFLEQQVVTLGFPRDRMILAHPGEKISIFGLDILPFASSHFRPNGNGVQEYGYYVTAPNSPSIVFPVDVRDFTKRPELPPADYCFAHVWLEDEAADPDSWSPVIPAFCRYMLSFSAKNILLTHLYEDGRTDDKMWKREHAEAIRQEIASQSPLTRVLIPRQGDRFRLE